MRGLPGAEREERMGSSCRMGTEFLSRVMKKFWKEIVVDSYTA